MKQQMLDRVADRAPGIAGLGINAHATDFVLNRIHLRIDIDVAIAGEMLQDGNCRILHDRADQALAAARNDQIDVSIELEQMWNERSISRLDKLHRSRIDLRVAQGITDNASNRTIGIERFLAAAQDDGIAALKTQRRSIARYIWPAFVEKEH